MIQTYLGLGSNVGNKQYNLSRAIELLDRDSKITVLKKSSVKETEPVDYINQPQFLNQIILIKTDYSPLDLLKKIKKIEQTMGRKLFIPKGPRIIDIDILLYGDTTLSSKILTIPHPGIKKRLFILQHLIELDLSLRDPETGKLYSSILQQAFGKQKPL